MPHYLRITGEHVETRRPTPTALKSANEPRAATYKETVPEAEQTRAFTLPQPVFRRCENTGDYHNEEREKKNKRLIAMVIVTVYFTSALLCAAVPTLDTAPMLGALQTEARLVEG